MSENGNAEDKRAGNSSEKSEKEVAQIRTFNQEVVSKKLKRRISPQASDRGTDWIVSEVCNNALPGRSPLERLQYHFCCRSKTDLWDLTLTFCLECQNERTFCLRRFPQKITKNL